LLDVAPRYFNALLGAPQFDVVACHLSQQAHHRIVASLDRSLPVSCGRLKRATLTAEEVDFPRGVETGLIDAVLEREVRRQRQRPKKGLVLTLFCTGGGSGHVDRRPEIGSASAPDRPGLPQPRFRHAQIEVRLHRAFDEGIEFDIVK
jgi:hypothetical protein